MNNRNELFDFTKKSILGRRNLKIKVLKLNRNCVQNNCEEYLKKMDKLNLLELDNEISIKNAINLGNKFHFNKNDYNTIIRNIDKLNSSLINDDIKLNNDYKHFCKTLKNDFSLNELEAIKNDDLYYIRNINIRNNLDLTKKPSSKKGNLLNIDKKIYNKFCYRDENIKKKILRRIKSVKNIIKNGIENMKIEERKKILEKDKINKILNKLRKESKNEVYSLINDQIYNKLFKSISEESFLREYNKKKYNSCIQEDGIGKFQTDRINESQNSIKNNSFSINNEKNHSLKIPKIIHYSSIEVNKNLIKNRLFSNYNRKITDRISSLKNPKKSFLSKSSSFINESRDDLLKKRFERIEANLERMKQEKEFYKNLFSKLKAGYKKSTLKKTRFCLREYY